jgi:hypothetical protein
MRSHGKRIEARAAAFAVTVEDRRQHEGGRVSAARLSGGTNDGAFA